MMLGHTKSKLSDRILKGFSAGALGQVLNMAGRLVLIPLFLHAWGAAQYGEWLLISSLPAWLALSDLGGQVYFINRMTAAWALKNQHAFKQYFSTALLIFLILPALIFLIFLVLILLFPVSSWLGVVEIPAWQAKACLLLLGFQVCISLPQGLIVGVFRAIGELPRGVMYGNALLIGQIALTVGCLASGGGVISVALVQLLPVLCLMVVAWRDLSKRIPGRDMFNIFGGSRVIAREAALPSLHFFGIQMSQALAIQGGIMVIGLLGATQVAVFGTLRAIVNMAKQMLGLLSHSAWPEFTRMHAAKEMEALRRLLIGLSRLTLFATLMFALLLHFFGGQLFELWLNGKLPFDGHALSAFLIYILLTICWTLQANVLMATNQHLVLARFQILFSVLGVAGTWAGASLGTLHLAIYGLTLGEALPMLVLTSWLLKQSDLGLTFSLLIKESLLALTAVIGMLVYPPACILLLIWSGVEGLQLVKKLHLSS